MRGTTRTRVTLALLALSAACGPSQAVDPSAASDALAAPAAASSGSVRAARRAYDGAPPVIPHTGFSQACAECHNERGVAVEGVGYAPPSPHADTPGMSEASRCQQCHVATTTPRTLVANRFDGLRQDLRRGGRLFDGAPPTIPHLLLMRENCQACHTGPAARAEVRTSHPERTRCRQCHVPQTTTVTFERTGAER